MGNSTENKDKKIEELTAWKDALENYFRNTIIPQLFVDKDLIVRIFTPPAMKQFNLSEKDKGKHIDQISTNIKFSHLRENIEEVIENNQNLEKEIQTTDRRWYQMNILPYIEKKINKANGVIITFVDITHRVELLKNYEKQKLNYENTIYSISHDLRSPLSNIEGLIKLINITPKEKEEEISKYLEMLTTSVANLRENVESLTDLSKQSQESDESVSVEGIIKDVQLALTDKIGDTRAKIKTEIKVPEIKYPKKDLRSIVYNLVSNALKFHVPERTPEILIRTEEVNGYYKLEVSDNGTGIEEEMKGKIFTRNTRLRKDVEGTGLGLFIVKRMVDETGGRIEVDSSVGEGSTFNVYLSKYK